MEAIQASVTDLALTPTAAKLWERLSAEHREVLDKEFCSWVNGKAPSAVVATAEHRIGARRMVLLSLKVVAADFLLAYTENGQVILANFGICIGATSLESQ